MTTSRLLLFVLCGSGFACETTEPVVLPNACPRDDLPDCSPAEPACVAAAWSYHQCLGETEGRPAPPVSVGPTLRAWPLRSMVAHRFAFEALGVWGAGEVPESTSSSVSARGIELSADSVSLVALSDAFSRFDDRPFIGNPVFASNFASSVDRWVREEVRATFFRSFVRAAREGGSFDRYLEQGLFFRPRREILDAPQPLLPFLQQVRAEALMEARTRYAGRGVESLEAYRRFRPDFFSDGPPTPSRVLPPPELPPGWSAPAGEPLGPDLTLLLLERPFTSIEGDLLVSGTHAGSAWFLWKIELGAFPMLPTDLLSELSSRLPFPVFRRGERTAVIGGARPPLPELEAIAETWATAD